MIARADTERGAKYFLNACSGRLCYGALLPLAYGLFGKSLAGRFYSSPTLALDIGGGAAWASGSAEPDELAGFLGFCGCRAVIIDEAVCPPPTGWHKARALTVFGLEAGGRLPLPAADEALWQSLIFDREPPAGKIADVLFDGRGQARRDDFYSETCSKLVRGKARVWALETAGGDIACTVGAYAIYAGQAYMACGQTAEPLRGRGIGGRLIVELADELASEGLRPVFLCGPERVNFYTRLGFDKMGELARYEIQQS